MNARLQRRNELEILKSLVVELASEIDLFYEDEDLPMVKPAMSKMARAVRLLDKRGIASPEVFRHLQRRFQKSVL